MRTQEIKAQIEKILVEIPKENLKDVLQYLEQVKERKSDEVGMSAHLRKIRHSAPLKYKKKGNYLAHF